MIDDADAVGERLRLVEVVRREHDRRAVAVESADEVPELPSRDRIESGRRLVEEEDLRATDEPQSDVEAAALPTGEAGDLVVRLLGQADGGDELVDIGRVRVDVRELAHGLGHGEVGAVGGLLEDDADAGPERGGSAVGDESEDGDLPGRRLQGPVEHVDRRRLPCPIGSEEAVAFADADREVDPVDGVERVLLGPPVGPEEVSDGDCVSHGSILGAPRSVRNARAVDDRCPPIGGHKRSGPRRGGSPSRCQCR